MIGEYPGVGDAPEPGGPRPVSDTEDHTPPLLYTVEEAARLLCVRPSWLRKKAAARALPCTFLGKHLRFSRADLDALIAAGAQPHPTRPTTSPDAVGRAALPAAGRPGQRRRSR